MNRWTLGSKIGLLLGLSCAAGLAAAILGLFQTQWEAAAYDNITAHELHDRMAVRELALTFAREVQDWKDTLLRGSNPEDLKKYSQAFHADGNQVRTAAAALRDGAADAQGAKLVSEFLAAHDALNASYDKALAGFASSAGKAQQAADRMVRGRDRPVTDPLNAATELFSRRAADRTAAENAAAQRLGMLVLAGETLAFAALGGVCWTILSAALGQLRSTAAEMAEGSTQVAAAATEVASSSQSLAQGSSEQAASLEEISATIEELAAMTRRNGDNSSAANAMMADAAAQVERSNRVLGEMLASMSAIQASSEKVARINKTIDEIAFQTNILALNAAVEAARAGAAGMGFAVVAEEVRNLAQRSAAAAKDTAALIEESIANSRRGAETLEQVSGAIGGITASTVKVRHLVEQVNEASQQQSDGIAQLNTAVAQVGVVTQSTAGSAEEGAAASEELNAQATGLHDLVSALHGLVEGSGAPEQAPFAAGRAERRGEPPVQYRPARYTPTRYTPAGPALAQPGPALQPAGVPRQSAAQKPHAPVRTAPVVAAGRAAEQDPFPLDAAPADSGRDRAPDGPAPGSFRNF